MAQAGEEDDFKPFIELSGSEYSAQQASVCMMFFLYRLFLYSAILFSSRFLWLHTHRKSKVIIYSCVLLFDWILRWLNFVRPENGKFWKMVITYVTDKMNETCLHFMVFLRSTSPFLNTAYSRSRPATIPHCKCVKRENSFYTCKWPVDGKFYGRNRYCVQYRTRSLWPQLQWNT